MSNETTLAWVTSLRESGCIEIKDGHLHINTPLSDEDFARLWNYIFRKQEVLSDAKDTR